MSLRLIYGRAGTGKSSFCYDEISKRVKDKEKIYIITPEQFSFTAEKKLIDSVENGAVINAEVLTFHRMAHRVMNAVGGNTKTVLSECGKTMLIYNILNNQKKKLKFLGKSEENINLIETQITEFKKHNVTVDSLKSVIDNEEDKYLKAKLNDMYIIYNEFQTKLENNYIDENDILTILVENLEKTDMFKNTIIYIDEFVGFTKQEYEIIRHLLNVTTQVNITICTDNFDYTINPDVDLFYSNKETKDKLINIAQEENIKIENGVFLKELFRFKNSELKHLEQNIYAVPYKRYEKELSNIEMFLAKNQYSEIEYVASNIIKLIRNENYRFKDIAVITKNLSTYSSLVKVIFSKYNIPVFIDEKKDLSQNVLVKYLIAILEIYSKNWEHEAVFNYIKTDLLDIDIEDRFLLENYCIKWGIKGKKWYQGDWQFDEETEENKDEIAKIKELRNKIVTPLVELKRDLDNQKTVENITKCMYLFLINNKINTKLEEKIQSFNENGMIELAKDYETSWKVIIQVFDEIVLVFKEDKMTYDKYAQILKTGLSSSGLGRIPGTQDQVIVGDIDRSRSHKVKSIFIIGLNDGVFPSVNSNEGFFNDNDRGVLKEQGIELAKGTIERLYEENFNIYKAFTTAEEKLFLSYASSDSAGASLRNSILVTKLKRIFTQLKEKSDVIEHISQIITKETTFDELLINLQMFRDGYKIDPIWFDVYNYYLNDEVWNEKLLKSLEGLRYTNLPKNISKENIEKLYGNTLVTSISKLEKYNQCEFSYYLKYGLRLSDKQVFKIEAVDTGTFMHETIDEFFNQIREKNIDIKILTEEQMYQIINEIIEEKLHLKKNYIFNATPKYKALVNRLKRVITKSMKYIIQGLQSSDFKVLGNEVEFGKGKDYKPIEIKLDNGKNVEIIGKIDRIDYAQNEDGKYIRIIDYKSSVKKVDLDKVVAGIQIQLLTYLDAVCKEDDVLPAGILYYNLIDPIIKANKGLSVEEIEQQIKEKFKMDGLILADVNVVKMMDNTLNEGKSSIVAATIKKDELSNAENNLNMQDFQYLQTYIGKLLKQITSKIYQGDIELKPYKKGQECACTYCSYKSICQFNPRTSGNEYNYISKKKNSEVIEMIKEQMSNS